jgi:dipeptidyl aminopeptidase/acylaminoacyl peptidase
VAAALTALGLFAMTHAFRTSRPPVPEAPATLRGRILYGTWKPELQRAHWFTVRPDGSETQDLHVVATCAVWWPGGSKILITNDAATGPGQPLRPATIAPDGSNLQPLDGTEDPNLNLGCGQVSPDASRMVLEGFNDSDPKVDGIYTVRASDGGDPVRLTHGHDASPHFSPDGTEVSFLRTREGVSPPGSGALFVIQADGAGLRRITPWGFAFLDQSWSPDGRWIAFQRPYGQLYLVHPDGTELHRIPVVLPPGAGALNPAWSPDGTEIAFSLTRDGAANVYTVRPDGTALEQVTHASGVNAQTSDWGG